jgi:hypothetical protein
MEYMARKLKEEYQKWGLTINLEKKNQICTSTYRRRKRNLNI